MHHVADLGRVRPQRQRNPANVVHGQYAIDFPRPRHGQADMPRQMLKVDVVLCGDAP
jgi:hypothetical protein